jgi:hypothetical protein
MKDVVLVILKILLSLRASLEFFLLPVQEGTLSPFYWPYYGGSYLNSTSEGRSSTVQEAAPALLLFDAVLDREVSSWPGIKKETNP